MQQTTIKLESMADIETPTEVHHLDCWQAPVMQQFCHYRPERRLHLVSMLHQSDSFSIEEDVAALPYDDYYSGTP
jgi:hypothetical protein